MQVVIDGHDCDDDALSDAKLVLDFLNELPARLGMKKLVSPMTVVYNPDDDYDWGVTGFVIIAESHIAVHTYPERGKVYVDIFSCKDFDIEETQDYVFKTFGVKTPEVQVIERSL